MRFLNNFYLDSTFKIKLFFINNLFFKHNSIKNLYIIKNVYNYCKYIEKKRIHLNLKEYI